MQVWGLEDELMVHFLRLLFLVVGWYLEQRVLAGKT